MTKLRRILLQGRAGGEKLDLISRYARMMVELGKRDPKVRDLAVAVTRGCRSKEYICEAKTLQPCSWKRQGTVTILPLH